MARVVLHVEEVPAHEVGRTLDRCVTWT